MSIEKIGGIIPPLVTPFRADGTIDEQAHRTEVRYMVERAGVHGLAVCGSTGEGHTLSTDETRRIVGWTVEEVKGRIPVIAGIITDSTQATIERAKAVADLGVAALQVTPVHYVFRPDDDSMVRHFGAIADQTGIPVIIYNVVPWSYLEDRDAWPREQIAAKEQREVAAAEQWRADRERDRERRRRAYEELRQEFGTDPVLPVVAPKSSS